MMILFAYIGKKLYICKGIDFCVFVTMSESEAFHWQQKYTPWKNPGIYHVTVTVTPKEPVLGSLCIPTTNNIPNPEEATIIRTDLGREVVHCVAQIAELHPEIRLLKYCLMPDHVHFILQVTQPMEVSIRTMLRGFQTGCRKAARCVGLDGASLFSEAPYIRSLSHAGQLQNMSAYHADSLIRFLALNEVAERIAE